MPLPIMKQNTRSSRGVAAPAQASAVRQRAPASAIESAITPTFLRSNISATAPAGAEISATGSINAVCTRATMSADAVIWVTDQAAPTPMIKSPRLDRRLAVRILRNMA
jgi:hypothetical protein